MKFKDPTLIPEDGQGTSVNASVGSAVELHAVPNWFRLACIRAFKVPREYHSGRDIIFWLQQRGGEWSWLDHWGREDLAGEKKGEADFISEPYGMHADAIRAAIKFSETIGSDVYVEACSRWYPTATIRIRFCMPVSTGATP